MGSVPGGEGGGTSSTCQASPRGCRPTPLRCARLPRRCSPRSVPNPDPQSNPRAHLLASEQGLDLAGNGTLDHLVREDGILGLLEAAFVLLPEDPRRKHASFLFQELLGDARTLPRGHLVALPRPANFASPLLEENPPLAVGRGKHHQ